MNQLSVVIITLNEEQRIGRCIDSVKHVADEILVVDSYSTDSTGEIAKEKGATFIQNKFEGHIQQKNFALEKASFDYVLSLDADEALNQVASDEILAIKSAWTHDSYSLNRLTNFCGKWIHHCGWYPDRKVRLFDRKVAKWAGVNPHDRIEIAEGATNKQLKGDILHYSFPTIHSHVKTANSFSEIAAKEAVKHGKKANVIVHLILNPSFTFFRKFFLQLGFLDGVHGFMICVLSAYANFLKYSKIWQLQRENSHLSDR